MVSGLSGGSVSLRSSIVGAVKHGPCWYALAALMSTAMDLWSWRSHRQARRQRRWVAPRLTWAVTVGVLLQTLGDLVCNCSV